MTFKELASIEVLFTEVLPKLSYLRVLDLHRNYNIKSEDWAKVIPQLFTIKIKIDELNLSQLYIMDDAIAAIQDYNLKFNVINLSYSRVKAKSFFFIVDKQDELNPDDFDIF